MAPQKGITLRIRAPSGEICPSKLKSKRTQGSEATYCPSKKTTGGGTKAFICSLPF